MKIFYSATYLFTALIMGAASGTLAQNDTTIYIRNANSERHAPMPIPEKGLKKENLFVGGSVTASFFSGGSVLGANPLFGYRLNDYLDAGAAVNFVYTGQRDYIQTNDKLRQFVYGPGIFVRAYPVPFLFAQVQPEYNFITQRYSATGSSFVSKTISAPSLLLGAGFASGRVKGSSTFFYMSIMFDVIKDRNSPYVNVKHYGTVNERVDIVPVIRAGVNVGLFQKRFRQFEEY